MDDEESYSGGFFKGDNSDKSLTILQSPYNSVNLSVVKNLVLNSVKIRCRVDFLGKVHLFEVVVNNDYICSDEQWATRIAQKLHQSIKAVEPTFDANPTSLSLAIENMAGKDSLSMSGYFTALGEGFTSAAMSLEYSDAQNKHDKQVEIAEIAETLPGVQNIVTCPCDLPATSSIDLFNPGRTCRYKGRDGRIYSIIQHLNDGAGWSREKIADWLDELHDSGQVNLEFEPWQEEGESNE